MEEKLKNQIVREQVANFRRYNDNCQWVKAHQAQQLLDLARLNGPEAAQETLGTSTVFEDKKLGVETRLKQHETTNSEGVLRLATVLLYL